jgi:t-SNARE complex subunit (syntaxin)
VTYPPTKLLTVTATVSLKTRYMRAVTNATIVYHRKNHRIYVYIIIIIIIIIVIIIIIKTRPRDEKT